MKLNPFIPAFLVGLLFSCQQEPTQTSVSDAESPTGYWYQQPLRIQQTVLRQPDAENYNVDSVVQYMKAVHANVLVVNGGGIVDYFQNDLPMANINPYIGNRDLLAEIVKGCHENDIKVIARVDFRGVHEDRFLQHPDWFARDEKNNPIILNYTTPGLYAPCYNGHYRNEHSVQFISQLFEKYGIDGIWHNSVNFHNTCYCHVCRSLYQEEFGKNLPVEGDPKEAWEEYYGWNARMANNQLKLMRGTVKNFGEDKAYSAEVFDMYSVQQQKHTGIDLYSAAEYFDFLVTVSFIANNSANVQYKDIYYTAAITKFMKSLKPAKQPVILFGGNGTEHRYIYDPPVDSRQWLWESVAAGGGFWNCYFNGSFPGNTLDRRNAYVATDAYNYLKNNSTFIQKLMPVTDISVFYSKPSGQLLGDREFANSMRGTLRFLEEAHYQYGFVSDNNLSSEMLDKTKVLILPNVASLSEAHGKIIRDWVYDGGNLIATHLTSLYDEIAKEREDFLLADVFGVHYTGKVANTEMDCYQKVVTRTDILKGFELTKLLHNGGSTLLVNADPGVSTVTGYLPKINNQPPENAFPENWDSPNPIVVSNRYGDGQVIYFANQIAMLNYSIGHPDYHDLLVNSVNSLLGNEKVLTTNAPASVHVYLNRSVEEPHFYQLSLVNTSSNTQRPLRELIPVDGIRVDLPFEINSIQVMSNNGAKVIREGNSILVDDLEEFCGVRVASP
ncbi:MAG: hypothetical protein O2887_11850 [Bacteroidetes bacterium]|nr:hypothetical protein [Bacteroidota bacterium]MDA1121165.1 hypothetical protein [Bacteroidota bacterium]